MVGDMHDFTDYIIYIFIAGLVGGAVYGFQIAPRRCPKCRKFFAGKISCLDEGARPSLRQRLLLPGAVVFFECIHCGEYWSISSGGDPGGPLD